MIENESNAPIVMEIYPKCGLGFVLGRAHYTPEIYSDGLFYLTSFHPSKWALRHDLVPQSAYGLISAQHYGGNLVSTPSSIHVFVLWALRNHKLLYLEMLLL